MIRTLLARRPRWLPGWLAQTLLAALATVLVYLVAVNLTLNTPLGHRLANLRPEKFQADWDGALSWYPGQLSVEGLRIRGQVRHFLWTVQADQASGRIALLPLLRKELRVPSLRARGVGGGVNRIAPAREPPEPRPGGWTLRCASIEAQAVRHVYLDGLLLSGAGRARAGFVKQLRGGALEVLPSTVAFDRARLHWRGEAWLRELTLDGELAIARHLRAEAPGLRKLALTDAELSLSAATAGMEFARDAQGTGRLTLVPGPGSIDGRLQLRRGVLDPGTELRLQLPLLAADATGRILQESLAAALRSDGRDLSLQARLVPVTPDTPSLDADLRFAGARLPVAGRDLRDPAGWLTRASGRVVADWHFGSLALLNSLTPFGELFALDGAGRVTADLRLDRGRLRKGSRLQVPGADASATVMGNRVTGRVRADIEFEVDEQDRALSRLDAVMERFRIVDGRSGRDLVEGSNLRLQVDGSGRYGELRQMRDAFAAHAVFEDARVPDLRVYNRYLPSGSLRFTGGSGLLSGDLYLDDGGEVGHGTLRVRGTDAALTFGDLALRGDVDVRTQLKRADLERRRFVLDGSRVDLSAVAFTGHGGQARDGWWTQIELDQARIDLDDPLAARGRARVRMSDAGFLLALYARDRSFPAWVEKIVDAGEITAGGELGWSGHTLVVDDLVASNDRFELRARMRMRGAQREGSLYARWGVLSLGAELAGDHKDLHLIGAREWYDAQPRLPR